MFDMKCEWFRVNIKVNPIAEKIRNKIEIILKNNQRGQKKRISNHIWILGNSDLINSILHKIWKGCQKDNYKIQ